MQKTKNGDSFKNPTNFPMVRDMGVVCGLSTPGRRAGCQPWAPILAQSSNQFPRHARGLEWQSNCLRDWCLRALVTQVSHYLPWCALHGPPFGKVLGVEPMSSNLIVVPFIAFTVLIGFPLARLVECMAAATTSVWPCPGS